MKEKYHNLCVIQGERLKECRIEKNLTQIQLAELTSYSLSTITKFETGTRKMSVSFAMTAAKVLDVRMEYLLCRDDIKDELSYEFKLTLEDSEKAKTYRAIIGMFDLVTKVNDGYIIGDYLVGITDFIKCTEEEALELNKYLRYVASSWFEEKLSSQTDSQEELKQIYKSHRKIPFPKITVSKGSEKAVLDKAYTAALNEEDELYNL